MIKHCIIIFTGFNQRAVISFIRTLEKSDVDYLLIARSTDDTICSTSYRDKVFAARKLAALDMQEITDILNQVKDKHPALNYLIAPSTEALNRFLLKNILLFEELGFTVPLVPESMYEMISDKFSFGQVCRKYDIQVPEESTIFGSMNIPYVAKPYRYFNDKNIAHPPLLILSENDRDQFSKNYEPNEFYYQKYIRGGCYYLLYYFSRKGEIFKFSQENIAQQPHGKSMVAAVPAKVHEDEISHQYEAMFQDIGFHGLVMIEIKEDHGIYYMIEANPRFWGPSQLFVDAGMNFFETLLFDYGYINNRPSFDKPDFQARYFWYGGIYEVLQKNETIAYHSSRYGSFSERSDDWLKFDIYRRNDTRLLFSKEINL